ncbi:MAG: rhomboid family intramembrane serine protease [Anaerolineales bacterium]
MFPIGDDERPGRGLAIVTLGLIVINVAIFLFEVSLGAGVENFVRTYGAVPREILTGQDVPPAGPTPLWIQLLTSMFLHGGWLHLIGNMAYLRVFGDDIEEAFGKFGYILFYLGTGLVASLTHIFLSGPNDTIPSVGASGAIAGVLGAYLVLFPNRQIHVLIPGMYFRTGRVSALVMLGFWFLLQFFDGIGALTGGTAQTGGVAVWAHIGGFVAGALVAFLLRGRVHLPQLYSRTPLTRR